MKLLPDGYKDDGLVAIRLIYKSNLLEKVYDKLDRVEPVYDSADL